MLKKFKQTFIGDRAFYINLMRLVIPMIILFIFFRKEIVTGVSRGGIKG